MSIKGYKELLENFLRSIRWIWQPSDKLKKGIGKPLEMADFCQMDANTHWPVARRYGLPSGVVGRGY